MRGCCDARPRLACHNDDAFLKMKVSALLTLKMEKRRRQRTSTTPS